MAEIKNRIGEFLLSGQVLHEEDEFVDGGGSGPNEGTPQSGDSLQTLEGSHVFARRVEKQVPIAKVEQMTGDNTSEEDEDNTESKKTDSKKFDFAKKESINPSDHPVEREERAMMLVKQVKRKFLAGEISRAQAVALLKKAGESAPYWLNSQEESARRRESGALPPADNHRASYAHPTAPNPGPTLAEPDFVGDEHITNVGNTGKDFGKKTERSLYDPDLQDDAEENEEEGEKKVPQKEGVDPAQLQQYAPMSVQQLQALSQEVSAVRAKWSGNKADPYYGTYLDALKKGKAIQQALRLKQGSGRKHEPDLNPVRNRSQVNQAWEAIDPKILVKKMVERGMTDAQIKHIMKTQFAPQQKKN